MTPTQIRRKTWITAGILPAAVLLFAACSRPPDVRPTPTFILDGPVFPGQPAASPVTPTEAEPVFLPVVSIGETSTLEVTQVTREVTSGGTSGGEATAQVTPTPQRNATSQPTKTIQPNGTPLPTATQTRTPSATPLVIRPAEAEMRFAVIGNFGTGDDTAGEVANMVRAWEPDIILTTGDNNLPSGNADTIDNNVGRFYHEYIFPYNGEYGASAEFNRFFPALGSHDWITDNARPHLDFFNLPGNERYYDFTYGPVHFFALDSDVREPDGTSVESEQAAWLETNLRASNSCWNFVYFFHPPYSSGEDGNSVWMQWPFASYGADAVFSSRDRHYERLTINSIPYFVNGLGGNTVTAFSAVQPGSQIRYNFNHGAQLISVDQDTVIFEFYDTRDELIDYHVVEGGCR